MDKRVSWTDSALNDLEQVADYISKDSPNYASAFVQEVLSSARSLNQYSGRGRVVPELTAEVIREVFVRHYRLIYKINNNDIFIIGFVHGGRNLSALWKKESR